MYQISAGTVKYFTALKKPPHTKPHSCYLLYKTTLLQQYCTTVQYEPLWKLTGVISEDAEVPSGGKADNVCLIALCLHAALRGVTVKFRWAGMSKAQLPTARALGSPVTVFIQLPDLRHPS